MVYFYGENSKWYEENASTLFHNNYSDNNSIIPKQFFLLNTGPEKYMSIKESVFQNP